MLYLPYSPVPIIFIISIISGGAYCYIYYRHKKNELQLPLLPTEDEIRNEDKVLIYFNDYYLSFTEQLY